MEKQKNRNHQNQAGLSQRPHQQRKIRQAFKQAPFIGGFTNKHREVDTNSPDNWATIQPDIEATALHQAPSLAGFGHHPQPSTAQNSSSNYSTVATNPMESLFGNSTPTTATKSLRWPLRVPGAIRFVQASGGGSPQPVRLPAYHAPAPPTTGFGVVIEFIAQLLGIAENDTGTEDTRNSTGITPDAADILMAGISKNNVNQNKPDNIQNATSVSSLNEPTMAFDYYLDDAQ